MPGQSQAANSRSLARPVQNISRGASSSNWDWNSKLRRSSGSTRPITKKVHALGHVFIGKVKGREEDISVNKKHNSEYGWFAYDKIGDLDLAFSDWEVIEDLVEEGLL
jgi:hypothetical protein